VSVKAFIKRWLARLGYQLVRSHRPSAGQPTRPAALRPRDVQQCRVLPNRDAILDFLPKGGVVAEVGVALGDFSLRLLTTLQPREFHAIDAFGLDQLPSYWGVQTKDTFQGQSHEQFYRTKMQAAGTGVVQIRKGWSWEMLGQYRDATFDVIYLDAAHDYGSVRHDADVAVKKLKPCGFLIFNDYTMFDFIEMVPYGVVYVVNDLCVSQGYEMLYLALQDMMFCDVVLRKKAGVD
jgi:hypothetical protein